MEFDLISNCRLIKLKFLIFNDYKIFSTIVFQTCFQGFSISHQKGISCIKKRLACGVEYSNNRESQKRPPAPIKVNISIYLTLQQISIRSENFAEYYICIKEYFDLLFSSPKLILQAQNKQNH